MAAGRQPRLPARVCARARERPRGKATLPVTQLSKAARPLTKQHAGPPLTLDVLQGSGLQVQLLDTVLAKQAHLAVPGLNGFGNWFK